MTDQVSDVLVIEAIMIHQAGFYTCLIRNAAGWTRHSHAVGQEIIVKGGVTWRICLTDYDEFVI